MTIHPTAIVEDGACVDGAEIGPYCHVGNGVRLGHGVVLHSHVVISGDTEIGDGTHVYSFAALGGAPQHIACSGDGARLVIGAGNVIREHVTMHRGTVAGGRVTRIGAGGYFMAGSHIAHDCQVGDNVILANNAMVGGHVSLGDYVFLGGVCALHQHCRIGDHAFIGGCAAVTSDVIPFASAVGNHARLVGLNVIGLKRRGFASVDIRELRAAYKMLFLGEGVFSERLLAVCDRFQGNAYVMQMVAFVQAKASRPLMTAERES